MDSLLELLARGMGHILHDTLLSPVFLTVIGVVLILERIMPADKEQPTLSRGFLQDGVWVVLAIIFRSTIVVFYADAITAFYHSRLNFMTLTPLAGVPEAVRLTVAVLVADLLAWFQHWLKHKVPWFWQIHAVHHSQRQLNVFTDYRFHLMEYIISWPIVTLPLLMLSIQTPTIIVYSLFTAWYPRFYHANIKTNLGLLRHILVTPQSHRVHHSIESRHTDLNFGVLFSFWDRLFGTSNTDADEYPSTGITDLSFPTEEKSRIWGLPWTAARQLIHPFVAIARSLRAPRA